MPTAVLEPLGLRLTPQHLEQLHVENRAAAFQPLATSTR